MKKIFALILVFTTLTWAFAQEEASNDTAPSEMQAMMAHMQTGPMHNLLANTVGDWKVSWTLWMGPDEPPVKTEGECTNEMILGGRYLQSKHKGTFMGMPMDGFNLVGYDNSREIFVSSWVDSMSTSMAYSEGTFDDATQTVNYEGFGTDPIEKKKHPYWVDMKMGKEKCHMVMYMEVNGTRFKSMELVFTRK